MDVPVYDWSEFHLGDMERSSLFVVGTGDLLEYFLQYVRAKVTGFLVDCIYHRRQGKGYELAVVFKTIAECKRFEESQANVQHCGG